MRITPKDLTVTEVLIITVYSDEPGVFTEDFCDRVGMIEIKVPKEIVYDFFIDECLEGFRNESDDKDGITDEGYFEDWLLEYTCDDTMGLWGYAIEHGIAPQIEDIWYP